MGKRSNWHIATLEAFGTFSTCCPGSGSKSSTFIKSQPKGRDFQHLFWMCFFLGGGVEKETQEVCLFEPKKKEPPPKNRINVRIVDQDIESNNAWSRKFIIFSQKGIKSLRIHFETSDSQVSLQSSGKIQPIFTIRYSYNLTISVIFLPFHASTSISFVPKVPQQIWYLEMKVPFIRILKQKSSK